MFYIYALMDKYQLEDVIHIENDVVLYYNCDELLSAVDRTKVYVPFNSVNINVISILYIPNISVYSILLSNWNLNVIDMSIFAYWRSIFPEVVDILPIFKGCEGATDEQQFVCWNYGRFGGKVFDGNAMGQYLGGIDPKNADNNTPSNTDGYVNERCCIKYVPEEGIRFRWKSTDEEDPTFLRPFLVVTKGKDGNNGGNNGNNGGEEEIPIFNLHIHSKDLRRFMGGAGFNP
jgi:hypothetical protein